MNKKHLLVVALVVGMLLGFVVGVFFRFVYPLSLWGVSQLYLEKTGSPIGEEYKGAVWRVVSDTLMTEFKPVTFNETLVKNVNLTALPSNVKINSEIQVNVWQSNEYPPYWYVPWRKINSEPITVIPKTYGTLRYWDVLNGIQFKQLRKPIYNEEISIEPVQVDVYTLDLDKAELHVPFLVRVTKTVGANTGPLIPSEYTEYLSSKDAYLIDISTTSITKNQQYSRDITFTNSKDSSEWLKMSLKFTIGDDTVISKPFTTTNILTIQPVGGGVPICPQNTFSGSENDYSTTLMPILLGWTEGYYSPTAYYYYWMGDPNDVFQNIFKGNVLYNIPGSKQFSVYYNHFNKWFDGTTQPVINDLLAEGLLTGTDITCNIYDYPGWYHPPTNVDHFWDKIYPISPDIYNSFPEDVEPNGTRPKGLSLCDYIASQEIYAPKEAKIDNVYDPRTAHSVFGKVPKPYLPRINSLNPYGDYYAFGKPPLDNYIAYLPLSSRSWLFTMDISSELADAIIVSEKYLDVSIENFKGGNVEIQPGESATLTMDLVNKLNLKGGFELIIKVDKAIPFEVSGTGYITFEENETRKNDYKVIVKNSYLIGEKITGNFKLIAWNGEKETSSVSFWLTFLPSAGLPNTGLSIRCVNKNNPSEGIMGVSITVFYGTDKTKTKSGYTGEKGYAPITLDLPYEGYLDIIAVDNYGRFYSTNKTDQYVSPARKNEFTIEMTPIGEKEFDLLEWIKQNLQYIIGGSIGIIGIVIGAYAVKRKRGVMY